MSKTTTKTTTTTEKFDVDGNLLERVTETTEEVYEDTAPNPAPWTSPTTPFITYGGGISEVQCKCGTGGVCYKHVILTNQGNTNPAAFTVKYENLPLVAQDAVSEDDDEPECGDSTCGCSN